MQAIHQAHLGGHKQLVTLIVSMVKTPGAKSNINTPSWLVLLQPGGEKMVSSGEET